MIEEFESQGGNEIYSRSEITEARVLGVLSGGEIRGQLLSPPLVFDIVTPNANLRIRKSQLPQYPEDLPLCTLEKTIPIVFC